MAQLRVVLNFVVAFALAAVLIVSWAGPKYISWDNTPGSGTAAMCVCSTQALLGANTLVSYQMTGCALGALLGAIAGITFTVIRKRQQKLAS